MTYRPANATYFGDYAIIFSEKNIEEFVATLGGWDGIENQGFLGSDPKYGVYAWNPDFLYDIEGAEEEEITSEFTDEVPDAWNPLQCTFTTKVIRRVPVTVNGVEMEALVARPGAALLVFYQGGISYGIVR